MTPWSLGTAVFGLGVPQPVLYAAMVVTGSGLGLFIVWWETTLATHVPPHLLSRVSAWDWMGSLALLPLGYLLAGPVAAQLGAGRVLVGGGLLATVAAALALLPHGTRHLPARPPEGPSRPGASRREAGEAASGVAAAGTHAPTAAGVPIALP